MESSHTPDGGVDVIVRYHAVGRELELDRALISAFYQKFSPVHLILVTQDFSPAEFNHVHDLVMSYDWEERHDRPTVINVTSLNGEDIRSKLLNAGITQCTRRFVAFLDYDDYIYEHAYQHLTSTAVVDSAALAFGGSFVKHVRVFADCLYNVRKVPLGPNSYSLRDLINDNLCPIHSFVVDRSVVSPEDLYFDESLTRLEDYDFLLRLSAKYRFSFSGMATPVCVYNWKLDGSNSIQMWMGDEAEQQRNMSEWNRARRHIWRMKVKARDHLQSGSSASLENQ